MVFVLCAFGAFFVLQAFKDVSLLGLRMKNWHKLLTVLGASTAISAVFNQGHPFKLVVYGLAGAGLAVVIHRLARLLTAAGDQSMIGSTLAARRRQR